MNLEIILNLVIIAGLALVLVRDYRGSGKTKVRFAKLEKEFGDALQLIKDKVDGDAEVNDARYSGLYQDLGTVDLKLSALGRASGFVLENGLWQKQKPAPAKPATVKKPTTATKKTTKGVK